MKCKRCELEKDDFPKGRRVCKDCVRKYHAEWKKNNPDKVIENCRRYRKNNLEKCRKSGLAHYYKNKLKYREYRLATLHKQREYGAAYRARNLEEIRKKKREAERLYRRERPTEFKARKMVHYAIKRGKLTRADKCQICGSMDHIEAHHKDYEKPLEVLWVCRLCHAAIHSMFRKPG